jgi:hypothetical protein
MRWQVDRNDPAIIFLSWIHFKAGIFGQKMAFSGRKNPLPKKSVKKCNMLKSGDYITDKVSFIIASLSMPVVVLPV